MRVVLQRGNVGIESFEGESSFDFHTFEIPGVSRMQISPDGRWLFGTTSFSGRFVSFFDLSQGKMVWKHPVEGAHEYLVRVGQPTVLCRQTVVDMRSCGRSRVSNP